MSDEVAASEGHSQVPWVAVAEENLKVSFHAVRDLPSKLLRQLGSDDGGGRGAGCSSRWALTTAERGEQDAAADGQ